MNNVFEQAMEYIKHGWHVLPVYGIKASGECDCNKPECSSSGKHPKSKNGSKDATREEAVIRQFCQYPHINLGIATGARSSLCVVDVDPRHGGDESLKKIVAEYGAFPDTVTVQTGSDGGMHFYFKYPVGGITNKTNVFPGIDIRGEGGYVVAPPSLHISGKRYQWLEGCGPDKTAISKIPEWLLNLIQNKIFNEISNSTSKAQWGEGARNDSLFRSGSAMRGNGMDAESIQVALLEENRTKCSPPLTDGEVRNISKSVSRYEKGSKNPEKINWQKCIPLPPLEIDVPKLADDLIPGALQDWVHDVTKRMQTSNEMILVPAIVALSGLIGRRIAIKPKKMDSWKVVPNLWGGIIAPPSTMKTPVMRESLKFLSQLETTAKENYAKEVQDYIALKKLKEKNAKEVDILGNAKDTNEDVIIDLTAVETPLPPFPIRKRYLINDSTTEKVGELLNQNPGGLTLFRDELLGFLNSLEKSNREGDRQFYLESYNGDGSFTFDRIGRGTVDIPALCLAILGGIQPDRLSAYFAATIKSGSADDGFLTRFQLLVYPPKSTEWSLVDQAPDDIAMARVKNIFHDIAAIDFNDTKFKQDQNDNFAYMRFSADAQEIFYTWWTALEKRLRSGEIESSAFEAHLTKYRKLMPSLSLIFHLIDFCDSKKEALVSPKEVSLEAAERAIGWCDFLEAHAKKVYADAIRPQIVAAHALLKRIKSDDIKNGMTVRNITRKKWSKLSDPKILTLGLDMLEEHHLLQVALVSPTGIGAPSEVVFLHPDLLRTEKPF